MDLYLQHNTRTFDTPALSTSILHKDHDTPNMNPEFNYRSVIGKLNFLEKSTHIDLSHSIHQCACFTEAPKVSHAKAVKCIGKYLLSTCDQGLIMHPDHTHGFECWVDLDFASNWKHQDAPSDPMMAKSRAGWVISYAGCPISWASKLQTITALSTTKAEYVALSMSLCDVIPLMGLLKEVQTVSVQVSHTPPRVLCKVFKDNSGALGMAHLILKPNTLTSISIISESVFRDARSHYMGSHNETACRHAHKTIACRPLSVALHLDHWVVTGLDWPVSTKREC